jgi:glycosyltransferase involved in cell wall biosynthesis
MSTSTVAATCALVVRRPFLALATTTGGLSEVTYLRSTRTWRLRRWLLGRASYVLAQTEDAREALTAVISGARIAVLPNPVDIPSTAPALDGRPRAAFAGRLSAEKNLFVLLDAWQEVATKIPSAHLTLFGEGGDFRSVEDELQWRVASDGVLRTTVSLPGWSNDMSSELSKSDVFVLPSSEEGMSNALLEACALGRIVVASDIPPNRSVLGSDYPLLVDVTDTNGFGTALITAFNADSALRRSARATVRERAAGFSTSRVVERLEELVDAAGRPRN